MGDGRAAGSCYGALASGLAATAALRGSAEAGFGEALLAACLAGGTAATSFLGGIGAGAAFATGTWALAIGALGLAAGALGLATGALAWATGALALATGTLALATGALALALGALDEEAAALAIGFFAGAAVAA